MENERRFAIIIGINDYEVNPLNYCVNDACVLKKKLIERCRFREEDIYLITSDVGNSNKEITGKYREAIRNIRSNINTEKDSILFYFAGHGNYKVEHSNVLFHDAEYPITEIFGDISQLNAKIQLYIIDSCHSGGKVLTRKDNKETMLEKFIHNSSGVMLLYACQSNEFAREESDKQHGLLTYHLIKAIESDDLYDDDEILTPSRIQEYVSRETSKSSNFEQIPVVENRITGYYPFAFLNDQDENCKNGELVNIPQILDNRNNTITYNRESRLKLQQFLLENVNKRIDMVGEKFKEKYKKFSCNDINDMEFDGIEKLIELLVKDSKKKDIEPINKIYEIKKILNPKYNAFSVSLFKAFQPDTTDIPKYIIKHEIHSDNEYFLSRIDTLLSNSIHSVSFGIGFTIYQSKWGIVLTTLVFDIEWDGEKDSIINTIIKKDYPFLLEEGSYKLIENLKLNEFINIDKCIEKWNTDRENELNNFVKVTVKDDK